MVFVKLQSLLQRLEFFHFGGGGEVKRPLRHFQRVGVIAGLGVGHAERVEHVGLRFAGQEFGLDGEHERGPAVANLRVFVGGQHVGGVGENLKIVRVNPQRRTQLINRLGIAALFETQLADFEVGPRISGIEPRGFFELGQGFVKTSEFGQDHACAVMQRGQVGVQKHGPAIFEERFPGVAQIVEQITEIIVNVIKFRRQFFGGAVFGERLV